MPRGGHSSHVRPAIPTRSMRTCQSLWDKGGGLHRGQSPSQPPTTRHQGQPNPGPGQGHRPAQQARGPSRCNPMAEAEAGRADSRTQQGSARVVLLFGLLRAKGPAGGLGFLNWLTGARRLCIMLIFSHLGIQLGSLIIAACPRSLAYQLLNLLISCLLH